MIYGIWKNHAILKVYSEFTEYYKQKMRAYILINKLDTEEIKIVEMVSRVGANGVYDIRPVASAPDFLGTDGVPFKTKGVTQ